MARSPPGSRRLAGTSAGAHRVRARQVPELVERLLAVENQAVAGLPRTAVDRLVGELSRLLSSLEDS